MRAAVICFGAQGAEWAAYTRATFQPPILKSAARSSMWSCTVSIEAGRPLKRDGCCDVSSLCLHPLAAPSAPLLLLLASARSVVLGGASSA